MSGVLKGIGKVFKKVGKIVKKIAPYIMIAAAIYFTGGAILAAAPALMGAAPVAATVGAGAAGAIGGAAGAGSAMAAATAALAAAPAAGAAVGSGIAATGLAGFISSAGSVVSGLFSSGNAGALLSGAASGLMKNMQLKDEQNFEKELIDDRINRHQVNDSSLFSFNSTNPDVTSADSPQGLGIRTAGLTGGAASVQTAASRPPRPSAIEMAQNTLPERRIRYNRQTGVIDFA